MTQANGPSSNARAIALLGAILCVSLVGCTVKVTNSSLPAVGSGSETETVPVEVQEEIAGARVELSSVKEELAEVVQSGQEIAPEILDALVVRLEKAEAQLESMLERAEKMEQGGHDHDGAEHDGAEHDGHDHDG